jgi:hypothetical protein
MTAKKTKLNVVNLKIESCLKCPHVGVERDPSSGDSFDWQDESLVCYNEDNDKKHVDTKSDLGGYEWKAPARRIVGYSRCAEREYIREKMGIPDWCPLRK